MHAQSDLTKTESQNNTKAQLGNLTELGSLAETDLMGFAESVAKIFTARSDIYNFTILQYSKFLIKELKICERIDYILPQENSKTFVPKDMNIMRKHVEWECVDDTTYQIADINGFCDYIAVQISKTDGVYEVCAPSHSAFWRFKIEDNDLTMCEPQFYFFDPRKTRYAMMLIEWFANIIRFPEKKDD